MAVHPTTEVVATVHKYFLFFDKFPYPLNLHMNIQSSFNNVWEMHSCPLIISICL